MPLTFHDGKNVLYKNYVGGKAWDDDKLLQLNPDGNLNHYHLKAWNTEDKFKELFGFRSAKNHKLVGEVTLGGLIESKDLGFIVVKGMHQLQWKGKDYYIHATIGYDGYLWHLDWQWTFADKMFFKSSSKGERATGVSHDGWIKA